MKTIKKALLGSIVILVSAYVGEPAAGQQTYAEVSFDGLVRIDDSIFLKAWVDPEIDLKGYNKIIPAPAEFEFRKVQRRPGSLASGRNSQTEFVIADETRTRLIDEVTAVFRDELAESKHFEVVEETGPDTLFLVGALLDIVSNVPEEQSRRGQVFLSQLGEATLVLELHDSQTGTTVYRAIDRRRIDSPSTSVNVIQSNPARSWEEVRRWARRWAVRLREGLDSIHEQ